MPAPAALPLPYGCTCFKLRKLTRAVTRLYDQHFAAVGLKSTQYALLTAIAAAPLPMALLAERLGAERTTLTRNLKPLLDAGWVSLQAGADSRQRIVTISKAGLAKAHEAVSAWRAAESAVAALLGEDGVQALRGQLDATYARLAEASHSSPFEELAHD